jgi:3,5-epimerase/4-reductase
LINCIGFTGRNVDECEKKKDATLLANTFVPIMLGEACLRQKVKLVHISSGCIYQYDYKKDHPINEEKFPDFLGLYYSRSKIYAEKALEVVLQRYPVLIVRIRIPLDNRQHPKNLLSKLVSYQKVINIPNSVTYIPDFVRALKHLLKIGAFGIYNVVNKGALRYSELMDIYKRYLPEFAYTKVDFKKLNLVRTNLLLSTQKLEKTGFKVRDIHAVLEECVRGYLRLR